LVGRLVADGVLNARSRAVLLTHSLHDDALLVADLLRTDVPWVGLLGPRRRTARVMRAIHERGALPPVDAFERLQTPVGLDLGGDDPAEVALSILAAVVASIHGREGGKLQDSAHGIHDAHERVALDTYAIILAAGAS